MNSLSIHLLKKLRDVIVEELVTNEGYTRVKDQAIDAEIIEDEPKQLKEKPNEITPNKSDE